MGIGRRPSHTDCTNANEEMSNRMAMLWKRLGDTLRKLLLRAYCIKSRKYVRFSYARKWRELEGRTPTVTGKLSLEVGRDCAHPNECVGATSGRSNRRLRHFLEREFWTDAQVSID